MQWHSRAPKRCHYYIEGAGGLDAWNGCFVNNLWSNEWYMKQSFSQTNGFDACQSSLHQCIQVLEGACGLSGAIYFELRKGGDLFLLARGSIVRKIHVFSLNDC